MKLSFAMNSDSRWISAMLVLIAATASIRAADPRFALWMTNNSGQYERVNETNGAVPVTTWPSPGIPNNPMSPTQTLPAYADVQAVLYSTNFVYVRSSDLASHPMGPWYKEYEDITVNGLWPQNRALTSKIPRFPQPATAPNQVAQGPVGVLLNGVTIANLGDGSGYNTALGRDAGITVGGVPGNQTNVWIRCATGAEGPILDGGFGHPAPDGGYHYHANPRRLRLQLGDNLSRNPTNDTFTEHTNNLHHSPILGWAYDGYPIYGPYAYSNAMDSNSPVRRMVSGHVPRDGSFGTVNLTTVGRHSLAPWAALFHTFTATLGSTDYVLTAANYGPNISTNFPIGWYAEDFDFLGDRIKPATGTNYRQGVDYDLDKPNGRICVTPEFPGGTYAYFIPVDASGAPAFPYSIGRYWYGNNTGGRVVNGNITQTVVTNFVGGPNAELRLARPIVSNNLVTLVWSATEGGTYQVLATGNLSSWTTNATGIAATLNRGTATTPATSNQFFRVLRTGLAPYDP